MFHLKIAFQTNRAQCIDIAGTILAKVKIRSFNNAIKGDLRAQPRHELFGAHGQQFFGGVDHMHIIRATFQQALAALLKRLHSGRRQLRLEQHGGMRIKCHRHNLTATARKNASTRKQGLVTHMNAIKITNGDATQAQQRNQLRARIQ